MVLYGVNSRRRLPPPVPDLTIPASGPRSVSANTDHAAKVSSSTRMSRYAATSRIATR